jgi:hypothetical protein
MDNQIDLKGLWARQPAVEAPDMAELVAAAGRVKRTMRLRLVLTNVCLVATIGWVGYVGLHYRFRLATTRIGIVLTLLSVVFYVVASNGLLSGPLRADPEEDNAAFLKHLLLIRRRQERLQGVLMNLYFALLTVGVGLYVVEFLVGMRLVWAVVAGGVTFGWILFSWFYLRPRTARKQLVPLKEVIGRLEGMNGQVGAR